MGLQDLFFEKPQQPGAKADPNKKPWTLLDVFFERPKLEPKAKK